MSIKINLDEKFGLFREHWRPNVIASLNGQEVKVIKVKGEFPCMKMKTRSFWSGRERSALNCEITLLRWDRESVLLCHVE